MNSAANGFTLLEVLMALAIFGLLSIAILGVYPNIFKTNSQTRDDQVLTIQAKRYLEKVQINYGDLVAYNKAASAGTPKKELSALVLPALPTSSEVNGYTCQATRTNKQVSGSTVLILRVELKCTRTNAPEQKFWIDLGRPA